MRLELTPETTAKAIVEWLMSRYPSQFSLGQTRTLQRRIAEWRQSQQSQEERLREFMFSETSMLATSNVQVDFEALV